MNENISNCATKLMIRAMTKHNIIQQENNL